MKQYIERSELVSRINKHVELTNSEEQEWVKDECIRQAHAMPSVNVGEWTSVDERLPDQELRELTSKDPLMTFRCMTARKSYYHNGLIYVYQAFYDERGFINENGVNITESVTHWMPLPEPPKGV